jgi:hypothetical protein
MKDGGTALAGGGPSMYPAFRYVSQPSPLHVTTYLLSGLCNTLVLLPQPASVTPASDTIPSAVIEFLIISLYRRRFFAQHRNLADLEVSAVATARVPAATG